MKIKTTGKSLKELLEEFGIGSKGFYKQDWYKSEAFFTEKPEAGEYEIVLDKNSVNKTYKEQVAELPKGYSPAHPAIIVEAILGHYKATSERFLEDWYVRTSSLDSDGRRVDVGHFDDNGLLVGCWSDDGRNDRIGVSSARKLEPGTLESIEPLEDLKLESAIKKVKDAGYEIFKKI